MTTNLITKFISSKKEHILYSLFLFAILLIRLWNISLLYEPWVWPDEAGYWSHAANMAGLSWTDVQPLWYSYGYSLLLTPLFWITQDITTMYHLAIFLNAIMGVFHFVLGKKIIDELSNSHNPMMSMLISFTSSCYSAYLYHSNIAWSETFLYTWFLLIIWSSIKFFKQVSWRYLAIFTTGCGFLYIIHNRSIVIFVAFGITLFYMMLKKRISWKKVSAALLILSVMLFADHMIKLKLTELSLTEASFSGNNISSQSEHLSLLLSLEGWRTLFLSLIGKLWYLLASTLMIAYIGILYVIKKLILHFKNKKNNIMDNMYFFYIFITLFICGTIAVSTITAIPAEIDYTVSTRLDAYFYGRYSDILCGILIISGLLYLKETTKKVDLIKVIISGEIIYLVCGGILYSQIKDFFNFFVNVLCVPGIYFSEEFDYLKFFQKGFVISLILSIIYYFIHNREKSYQTAKIIIACSASVIIFIQVASNSYAISTAPSQIDAHSICTKICDVLNSSTQYKIYSLIGHGRARQVIRDRVVNGNISYKMPAEPEENYFIVTPIETMQNKDLFKENIYYITIDKDIILLGTGNELKKKMQSNGYYCQKTTDLKFDSLTFSNMKLSFADDQTEETKDDLLINITITNNSDAVAMNDSGYKLSYHIYDETGNLVLWDGPRFDIDSFLSETTIPVFIPADIFNSPGKYIIEFDLVQEGIAWFSSLGGQAIRASVQIGSSGGF